MKNWKLIFNAALLGTGLVWLSSCDGGDEVEIVDPSIALTGQDIDQTEFQPGETIDLTVNFTAPQGLAGLNWYFYDAGDNLIEDEFNNPDDANNTVLANFTSADVEGSVPVSIPVPEGNDGETLTLIVEIADVSSANSATETLTFTVKAGIYAYEAVLLGGFDNNTLGSFYNSVDNVVYKRQEAATNSSMVDFLYYYANTPENTIAAPDNEEAQITWDENSAFDYPLTTQNSTVFKTLDASFDFDAVTTTSGLENSFPETGNELSRVTDLQVGQVVAFRLDNSRGARFGLFEVAEITGTSGTDRAITLNVKVQSSDN